MGTAIAKVMKQVSPREHQLFLGVPFYLFGYKRGCWVTAIDPRLQNLLFVVDFLFLCADTLLIPSHFAQLADEGNMTYYPRVMKKPKNTLVNGSVAILIPKDGFELTEDQMRFFSTDEYRKFYWVARNHQTSSLNLDSCSVPFFGVKKAK